MSLLLLLESLSPTKNAKVVSEPHGCVCLDLMTGGIYENSTFVTPAEETWLALSLSEAFAGWHCKLVAGAVVR